MPELPEVETTCRGIEPALRNRRIARVEVVRRDLRQPVPPALEKALQGLVVRCVTRRAKYVLVHFKQSTCVLVVHLGMSGSLCVVDPTSHARRKHDHVFLHLDSGTALVFHDPRRFGLVLLVDEQELETHKLFRDLGPEPFSDAFNEHYLKQVLAGRTMPIKPVLMEAGLVVGVGNIYASEALFAARISPLMPANKAAKHAGRIIPAIREVLQAAIASGGSTLRDFVGAGGEGGYFQHEFKVYGRTGEPCMVCGTLIKTIVQAGRSTFFCSVCQPAPRLKKRV